MLFSTTEILNGILQYKYVLIFPVAIIEGPIITIMSGFLAAHGFLNVLVLYPILVLGDLTGDLIYYFIGFLGGKDSVIKWGKFVGLTRQRLERLEEHFEKRGGKLLIFGKISHGIGSGILMAAGLAKMPLKDFFWFNLLGTLPKSLFLLIIGYYFGQAYQQIKVYFDYTAIFFIGSLVIVFLLYLLGSRLRQIFNSYLT